jgi:hypothetical protein
MKKQIVFLIILAMALIVGGCSGCVSHKGMLREIPEAEFKEFSYHRAGNVTSADIVAKNAKIENGKISIGAIDIKLDYGPAVNWNIHIEGYSRRLAPTKKE